MTGAKFRLFLSLFMLTMLPPAGLMLLKAGLNLKGYTHHKEVFFLVAGFQLLFIGVIAALFRMKYRGSLIPLAAMILLTGMGLLLQTRLIINDSTPTYRMISENNSSVNQNSRDNTLPAYQVMRSLGSHLAAYCGALIALVCTVYFFSGRRFEWLGKKYMLLFAATITGLGVLIGFSHIFNGGKFLFSRIPWEFAKVSLPLVLAGFFADNGRFLSLIKNGKFSFSILSWGPFIVITAVPLILFAVLGDFGQIMIYGVVILCMLYVATKSFLYPLFGVLCILFIPAVIDFVSPVLPEYVAARWDLWHHFWIGFPAPEWWNRSYQTANAFFALQAGGFGGTGLGLGHPAFVPLSHSDFIFVEVAEELGFIGSLAIFLLYLCIIITGIRTAFCCSHRFSFLAVTALTLMFCCQVFINIGGVINVIPLTGIVLPFLSRGGFSLVTFSVLVGLLMAVSHKNAPVD